MGNSLAVDKESAVRVGTFLNAIIQEHEAKSAWILDCKNLVKLTEQVRVALESESDRLAKVAKLDSQIIEKDAQLVQKEAQLTAKKSQIGDASTRLANLERQEIAKQKALDDLDVRLTAAAAMLDRADQARAALNALAPQ